MKKTFKDCYIAFNHQTLKIGNSLIERIIAFKNGYPVTKYVQNKKTGYTWQKTGGKELASFNLPVLNFEQCEVQVTSSVTNHFGLSEDFLRVCIQFDQKGYSARWEMEISPESPFISSRLFVKGAFLGNTISGEEISSLHQATGIETSEKTAEAENLIDLPVKDAVEAFPIEARHLKLETIRFYDVTDIRDNLVKKAEEQVYARHTMTAAGNVFVIDSYLEDEGLMLVKDGLTVDVSLNRTQDELVLNAGSFVQLTGTGIDYSKLSEEEYTPCYGSTVGVGSSNELKRLYKKYYKAVYRGDYHRNLFMMSNTWGDRNQDKAVCEEFMLKELQAAEQLGIDILQIDDGWEKGITANSAMVKGGVWEGYYAYDPDFWEVNTKKFPRGLKPLVNAAKEKGMRIGLWFSPDASNDYSNWEKDGEALLHLYKTHDIRYFKLDGIKIRNKKCEINFIKLMEKVTKESNNRVSFNLDITAEVRFGYLYEKHLGTLFVENRYTDWGNYCPHKTLKNLWQLSEIFPARKFQFEVLNNKRNKGKYENDPLAPSEYSMDYLFAITMFSNPLIWMEMSNLDREGIEELGRIIEVYKKERQKIFDAEVFPIGNVPDGVSFTGFQAVTGETEGYLLLFRELTQKDSFRYSVNDLAGRNIRIEKLYANASDADMEISEGVTPEGRLQVQFRKPRSFVFAKYRTI